LYMDIVRTPQCKHELPKRHEKVKERSACPKQQI
jgi:hypothetical protein